MQRPYSPVLFFRNRSLCPLSQRRPHGASQLGDCAGTSISSHSCENKIVLFPFISFPHPQTVNQCHGSQQSLGDEWFANALIDWDGEGEHSPASSRRAVTLPRLWCPPHTPRGSLLRDPALILRLQYSQGTILGFPGLPKTAGPKDDRWLTKMRFCVRSELMTAIGVSAL